MAKVNCVLATCVEDELWAIWEFIAKDNAEAATHVIEFAFLTFNMLAQSPELGRLRKFRHPSLTDIRSWPVKGYATYLVFYRATAGEIQILHVYHGARDIEALFDKQNP